MEERLVEKLKAELKSKLDTYRSNRERIYRSVVNTSEKYIAVETEQKNFILSKIEKIEKQLQDLKASLKKTVEGIQKEEMRLTGIEDAIEDFINISEQAIEDSLPIHRFLLKYSQALKADEKVLANDRDAPNEPERFESESKPEEISENEQSTRKLNLWLISSMLVLILSIILGVLCLQQKNLTLTTNEEPHEGDKGPIWTDLYFRPRDKIDNNEELDHEPDVLEDCEKFENTTGSLQQFFDGIVNYFLR